MHHKYKLVYNYKPIISQIKKTFMDYKILNNQEKNQFEAVTEDKVIGLINYIIDKEDNTITVPHTEVNPEYEGQGIAGAMTQELLEYAKNKNLKVIPICPYTRTYIDRHPQYKDLL